jgi:hypothetical protein
MANALMPLLGGPDSSKSFEVLLDVLVNNSGDAAGQPMAGESAYRHEGPSAEVLIAIATSNDLYYHIHSR